MKARPFVPGFFVLIVAFSEESQKADRKKIANQELTTISRIGLSGN